jgi:hypothetical protein
LHAWIDGCWRDAIHHKSQKHKHLAMAWHSQFTWPLSAIGIRVRSSS